MVGVLVVLALAFTAIWFTVVGGLQRRRAGGRSVPPPVLPPLADVEFAAELAAPAQPGGEQEPGFPVEQPEAQDELTDIPNGAMPRTRAVTFTPGFEVSDALMDASQATAQWDGAREAEPAEAEPVEVPPAVGTDAPVTAIPRGPRSLYVSWERPEKGEARLRAMLGPERFGATTPCLRLFDLGSEQHLAFDLGDADDHRFLQNLEPGRRYILALERRSAEGAHYLLSLSQAVSPLNGTAAEQSGPAPA